MSAAAAGAVGRAVMLELAATLEGVAGELDWARAEAVAARLDGARRVLLFGAGRSRGIALAMGQRFGHVGLDVALIGEGGNRRFDRRDVLILVSASGTTRSTVVAGELGREAPDGGSIVAFTATDPSPVADLADEVLRVPARFRSDGAADLAPFTAPFDLAALACGEALAKMVMERRGMTAADIELHRPNVE
jgi:DNA-binding MurR/RpiR family transcriptional regulator